MVWYGMVWYGMVWYGRNSNLLFLCQPRAVHHLRPASTAGSMADTRTASKRGVPGSQLLYGPHYDYNYHKMLSHMPNMCMYIYI